MTLMTLAQAQALLPGSTLVGEGATAFARVHSDTRTLAAGDLFVALKGASFDAHDFLPQARAAGAVAAIATHGLAEAGLPGLQVADTLGALQTLARGWRAAHALPLVAVTGSNGKTTVTQMIASILRAAHGEAALATAGNYNNHIGVPLTVLRLSAHRAAVVELGMNHPGEIAELAAIAQPTVALINNAQREHLEFMHSVEAVARENGSVIAALPADGVAVFPADDAFTPLWRELAGARRVTSFALEAGADVTATAQWQLDHWAVQLHTPAGEAALRLRIAGRHNVKNALAATAAALAAGVSLADVVRGLDAFEPVKGRSQVRPLQRGGVALSLIDDTYNANPDSMRAAVDVLAALPAPRWLVLGDMGEVGDQGPAFHAEIGQHARASGVEHLWCAGQMAAHMAAAYGLTPAEGSDGSSVAGSVARSAATSSPAARHFDTVAQLLSQLGEAPEFASVLVKGSRFMKMEQVVAALQAGGATEGGAPHAA